MRTNRTPVKQAKGILSMAMSSHLLSKRDRDAYYHRDKLACVAHATSLPGPSPFRQGYTHHVPECQSERRRTYKKHGSSCQF